MSCDHAHHHHHGSDNKRIFIFALLLTTGFAFIEAIGGLWGHSLALLSDAGHMFTDGLSLGIGAGAAFLAKKPASKVHSFGLQRAEVLGALINALLMVAVVAAIVVSAIQRLITPVPAINGTTVMLIAAVGLLVNIAVGWVLLQGEQNLNIRGALLHVAGDLLGSLAALIAGWVIYATGWTPIDPILSLLVAVLIGISALRLLKEVIHVLMEAVPAHIDAIEVAAAMANVDGIKTIHDLHIWTISSNQRVLSAHVELDNMTLWCQALPRLQSLLHDTYGIDHTTLQPEDQVACRYCTGSCGIEA